MYPWTRTICTTILWRGICTSTISDRRNEILKNRKYSTHCGREPLPLRKLQKMVQIKNLKNCLPSCRTDNRTRILPITPITISYSSKNQINLATMETPLTWCRYHTYKNRKELKNTPFFSISLLLVLQITPIWLITPPALHIYVAQVPFHTWFNYRKSNPL